MQPLPVLTPDQAATWDRLAVTRGIDLGTLMECAGRAVAAVLAARHPAAARRGVVVAAGHGHNGGDGWVLARALHRHGLPVWVAPIPGTQAPLTKEVADRARTEGVREVAADGPWPAAGVLVDALLGTGASGAPRGPVGTAAERLTESALPIVAVDGPTGLDLANGVTHGSPRADLTVTFGGLRRGHLMARDACGDLVVADIGHPPPEPAWPSLVTDDLAAAWLPRLRAADHKGTRGRVVVVGGAPGMSGALRLAARAAFAAGAGLVHAVAPSETLAVLAAAEPDLQTLAQDLDLEPSPALLDLVARADAIVIGPGLGRGGRRRELVERLLAAARAAVVDADALVAFAGDPAGLASALAGRPGVLTPHVGEFRTLAPHLAGQLEVDPWAAATGLAAEVPAAVLLKGVPTVVARAGTATFTVAAGNPGLATGGSGDVLGGLAGAALARGIEPELAAALAAQVLGRAADLGARRVTARGLRPMDVIGALPDLWRSWDARRLAPPPVEPPVLLQLPRPVTT
jgi:NAD(P)H-hydrate epimerase